MTRMAGQWQGGCRPQCRGWLGQQAQHNSCVMSECGLAWSQASTVGGRAELTHSAPSPLACRRLRSLDVTLEHPDESPASTLPLSLAALPEGLTHLRLVLSPPALMSLPAGDYLRCLRSLTLGPMAALSLTPLLPFMPEASGWRCCQPAL